MNRDADAERINEIQRLTVANKTSFEKWVSLIRKYSTCFRSDVPTDLTADEVLELKDAGESWDASCKALAAARGEE